MDSSRGALSSHRSHLGHPLDSSQPRASKTSPMCCTRRLFFRTASVRAAPSVEWKRCASSASASARAAPPPRGGRGGPCATRSASRSGRRKRGYVTLAITPRRRPSAPSTQQVSST